MNANHKILNSTKQLDAFYFAGESSSTDPSRLAIRGYKYLNAIQYIAFEKSSNTMLKKLKHAKTLRNISSHCFKQKKWLEQVILKHHRTLKNAPIQCGEYKKERQLDLRRQIRLDEYTLYLCKKVPITSFLTKLEIKTVVLDFATKNQSKKRPKLNIPRLMRQLGRINNLKNVKIMLSERVDEEALEFLEHFSGILASKQPNTTVSLETDPPKRDHLNSYIQVGDLKPQGCPLSTLRQRITHISAVSEEFLAWFFSGQISQLKKFKCLELSIPAHKNEERDEYWIDSFLPLANSTSLKTLHLAYGREYDPHQDSSRMSPILLNPMTTISNLLHLEDLKLEFCAYDYSNLAQMYSLLVLITENMRSLRKLHFALPTRDRPKPWNLRRLRVFFSKIKSFFESLCPMPYFSVNDFLSRCFLPILDELHLELPGISFEGFNEKSIAYQMNLNKVHLCGKFAGFDGLVSFFKVLKPSNYNDSTLSLIVLECSGESVARLFQQLSMISLNFEEVVIQIHKNGLDEKNLCDSLIEFFSKLIGPKTIYIRIHEPQLVEGAEDLIYQSIEKSNGQFRNVSLLCGFDKENWSWSSQIQWPKIWNSFY